jgi:hypothetical protein
MRKIFKVKLLVLNLFLAQTALAETTPLPDDFAFVATLSEGKQSLRQFELPYQVLAKLERQDYGDLRIFNSQNQSVPFKINVFEPTTLNNTNTYELNFFRLADHSAQQSGMQIEFGEQGTRLSFRSYSTEFKDGANSQLPNYLIFENQHQNDELHAIKLDWQQAGEAFSIKVRLEGSEDLQSWQVLNESTTLYDLKHAQMALTQNTINLPSASHAKYLRLSFLPTNDFTLQVAKISGEYHHATAVERENWESFPLTAGKLPNEWLFNTGSFVPVSKIAVEIPAAGLFYQGNLYSKNGQTLQNFTQVEQDAPHFRHEIKRALHHSPEYPQSAQTEQETWNSQGTVMQYRLVTAAGEISSEPIEIATVKDREWKLVLHQPATLLPEQLPTIKVAWHPVIVSFLAQGNPPYKLFFGNAKIAPFDVALPIPVTDSAVESVNIDNIQSVTKNAAAIAVQPTLIERSNWREILLWVLLSGGVLVMCAMVYQLYVRMNQRNN